MDLHHPGAPLVVRHRRRFEELAPDRIVAISLKKAIRLRRFSRGRSR
jgi:hypothetical protein